MRRTGTASDRRSWRAAASDVSTQICSCGRDVRPGITQTLIAIAYSPITDKTFGIAMCVFIIYEQSAIFVLELMCLQEQNDGQGCVFGSAKQLRSFSFCSVALQH